MRQQCPRRAGIFLIFINTFDFQGAPCGNRHTHTTHIPSPNSGMWVAQHVRSIQVWLGLGSHPHLGGWPAEMEVFKKWFYKGSRPIPGFVPDARMERGHVLRAAGLVGTLKTAVKTRSTLHLDRTRLASAGPSGQGILRSQRGP